MRFDSDVVEVMVTGIEGVSTEAVTFQAIKLVKEDRPITKAGNRSLTTYYRSEQKKSVVKLFFDSSVDKTSGPKKEIELIKHGLADTTELS